MILLLVVVAPSAWAVTFCSVSGATNGRGHVLSRSAAPRRSRRDDRGLPWGRRAGEWVTVGSRRVKPFEVGSEVSPIPESLLQCGFIGFGVGESWRGGGSLFRHLFNVVERGEEVEVDNVDSGGVDMGVTDPEVSSQLQDGKTRTAWSCR